MKREIILTDPDTNRQLIGWMVTLVAAQITASKYGVIPPQIMVETAQAILKQCVKSVCSVTQDKSQCPQDAPQS
jgi:hypothetical protein